MKNSHSIIFLCISFFSYFGVVPAQDSNSPFKLDSGKDAALIGAGTAAGITALAILLSMDPLQEAELQLLNPLDVNELDRSAIGKLYDDHLGDALLWGSYLLPLTFLADEQAGNDFGELAVMYGEVLLINASLNGIVKGLTKRVRPFVYDQQSPLEERTTVNAKLSFYSGHVSVSASNSFFTAAVLNEYVNDNTTKILIWSAAAIYPAVVCFERVINHWHFPTDVIVGYIIGAAIGYLVPLIHKTDDDKSSLTSPAENFYKPVIGFKLNF